MEVAPSPAGDLTGRRHALSYISGIGFAALGAFIYFLLIDRHRPAAILALTITAVLLSVFSWLLFLLPDLAFAPERAGRRGPRFAAGLLLFAVAWVAIKAFKSFSAKPYEVLDGVVLLVSALIASVSTVLLLYSMFHVERTLAAIQRGKDGFAFLSGAIFCGLAAYLYFFLFEPPSARPLDISAVTILCAVLAGLSVTLNLIDDILGKPEWKRAMNFVSGIVATFLGAVLILVFKNFGAPPYSVLDGVRALFSSLIAGFGTYLLLTSSFLE